MKTSSTAVVIRGLAKRYGDVTALDGIDLDVAEGSVHALLGPNGAGKTTTVDTLTTLVAPDSGRAAVLGHDVVADAGTVRVLLGVTGQHPTVDAMLTGRENLTLVARLAQLPWRGVRPRVDELLDEVGLSDAADLAVKGYSGGMRRRLDLAAALVADPPLLLLDEPTTGLDPHSRASLWSRIRSLRDGGTTIVLTTQYLEEADHLADQVAVLDHGRIIAEGTPAELKARLAETTIEMHLADARSAREARTLLARFGPLPPSDPADTAVHLHARPDTRLLIAVLRELDEADLTPRSLSVREATLDDVFLAITGNSASRNHTPATAEARP